MLSEQNNEMRGEIAMKINKIELTTNKDISLIYKDEISYPFTKMEFTLENGQTAFLTMYQCEQLRKILQKEHIKNVIERTINKYDFHYNRACKKQDLIDGFIAMYEEYIDIDGDAEEELEDRIEQTAESNDIY